MHSFFYCNNNVLSLQLLQWSRLESYKICNSAAWRDPSEEACKMLRGSHCLLLIIWQSHVAITYFIVMFLSSDNKSVFMTFPLIAFLLKIKMGCILVTDNEKDSRSWWIESQNNTCR